MVSLDIFFEPKSVAVIGASRYPEKIGYAILENLKDTFKGDIYPVNPNAEEILGLPCYENVNQIEEKVDLAIIAVKAELVPGIIKDCIKKKIKGAIIISSGFGEIGNKKLEEEVKKLAKGKISIIGPNCIGTFSPGKIDTMFLGKKRMKRPKEGGISFITQSGAVGSVILDVMADEGIGISKFVSYGNAIDIDETDLIKYLGKDIGTRAIAIYLEGIKDGKKFIEAAKKVAKEKPIICLKAGKTEKGSKAVMSHTGAMAGSEEIYSTAFKQAGIIEVESIEELIDFSKILANQPLPKSNKLAIITDGGGFGILATDSAEKYGLEVTKLSSNSIKRLKKILPKYASMENPVDLTGDATAERYQKSFEIIFKDNNIDSVLAIVLLQVPTLEEEILGIIRDCKVYGKPFAVCMAGSEWTKERIRIIESFGVPVYPTPERAAKALSILHKYQKLKKE